MIDLKVSEENDKLIKWANSIIISLINTGFYHCSANFIITFKVEFNDITSRFILSSVCM